MTVDNAWESKELRQIADVRVSNVDKKTEPRERPVKLCNYMDVYTNEYIRGDLQFMEASATPAEIERFGLSRGDVIITKDSETPDDIGIPAVLVEDVDRLVCGYHLALIRPNENRIDSVYLAKQLSTPVVARYFGRYASGSTRFGLSVSAIESVSVPVPRKAEQEKIAAILLSVDRAIHQIKGLLRKQQRIRTGLMQDLLTRGIGEAGRVRSEDAATFKDSPLGKIPTEWHVKTVAAISTAVTDGDHLTPTRAESGIYLLSARNILNGHIDVTEVDYVPIEEYVRMARRCNPEPGDILLSCSGTVGRVCQVPHGLTCALVRSVALIKLNTEKIVPRFAEWAMRASGVQRQILRAQRQAAQPNLFQWEIERLELAVPALDEQLRIGQALDACQGDIDKTQVSLTKLRLLRIGLMQDLLTGRTRVTPLLEAEAAVS